MGKFLNGLLDLVVGVALFISGYLKMGWRFFLKLLVMLLIIVACLAVCATFNFIGVMNGCAEGLRLQVIPPIGHEQDAVSQCMKNTIEGNLDVISAVAKNFMPREKIVE